MNKKAIFLDIDGTLVNHHGKIPDSAREAIAAARKKDMLFLCVQDALELRYLKKFLK